MRIDSEHLMADRPANPSRRRRTRLWAGPAAIGLLTGWAALLPWEGGETALTRAVDDLLHPRYLHCHSHPLEWIHHWVVERTDTGLVVHEYLPQILDAGPEFQGIEYPDHLFHAECVTVDCGGGPSRHGPAMVWWESEGLALVIRPVNGYWSDEDIGAARRLVLDAAGRTIPDYFEPAQLRQLREGDTLRHHVRWVGVGADLTALAAFGALLWSVPAWFALVKPYVLITREPWQCRRCGYDLRGCGASVCPECGAPTPSPGNG